MTKTIELSEHSPKAGSWFSLSKAGYLLAVSPQFAILIREALPILFAALAYAWPIYTQITLSSDIRVTCAPKVYTANQNSSRTECFAYSAATGLFTAVGSRNRMEEKYATAPIRDLGRNFTVLPGLHDSHGHIMHVTTTFNWKYSWSKYGEMLDSVNLFGADSFEGNSLRGTRSHE